VVSLPSLGKKFGCLANATNIRHVRNYFSERNAPAYWTKIASNDAKRERKKRFLFHLSDNDWHVRVGGLHFIFNLAVRVVILS
jgi:hypothetical protein